MLAGVFLAVQLVAVYLPGSPDGGLELPWLPGADKIVHFLIFAIPVYLFGRLSGRVGLVAGLFAVHAVVSEFVQWRFIPYRDGDVVGCRGRPARDRCRRTRRPAHKANVLEVSLADLGS